MWPHSLLCNVQPFLHHEGGVLQGESSWIYPLARHSRARAAVSAPHLPYSRSQLPARADRMPSIDTLSNFVHTKASRQYKGPTSLNHLGARMPLCELQRSTGG